MIFLDRNDDPLPATFDHTDQEWGLALLFSVEPTDRALYGHALAGSMGTFLESLAGRDS